MTNKNKNAANYKQTLLAGPAAELRDCFYQRRNLHRQAQGKEIFKHNYVAAWDGGTDARCVAHKEVWSGLAAVAAQQQLSVVDWVEALFDLATDFGHDPRPHDLKRADVLALARRWADESGEDVACQVQSESLNFLSELNQRRNGLQPASAALVRSVLIDPRLPLSPLMRYVLARQRYCQDVADHYHQQAVLQLARAELAYLEVIGEQLLSPLLASVAELRGTTHARPPTQPAGADPRPAYA